MLSGYTVYTTYALVATNSGSMRDAYSQSIHCNYISKQTINTNDINSQEISFYFTTPNDFKFLNSVTGSTGYTIHAIYGIVQVIDNSDYEYESDIKPINGDWKYYDVTNQISGYTSGKILNKVDLTNTVFKIPLLRYNSFLEYNLDYLNYPIENSVNDLCFGDENYFFGNVSTEIKADVYTTDISINLQLNEYNNSDNLTWDSTRDTSVYISEVAIYDDEYNLVAIGKLNNPVEKNSTIARTIVFALDF